MRNWLLPGLLLISACVRPELPPMTLPAADALLRDLQNRQGVYRSLDAEAKIGITVEGRFFSSQQFILLERPDRLRTDVLSAFGQLLLQLAVDRDQLRVFNNTKVPGIYYQGAASDDNLARFTRLPVRFREMVRLLLYDLPLVSARELQVSSHPDGVQLTILGDGRHQEVVFDRLLRPLASRYFQNRDLQLEVIYKNFAEQDGFPRSIHLELPRHDTSASLRFSQLRTNIDIPAERFVINPPGNAIREDLPD